MIASPFLTFTRNVGLLEERTVSKRLEVSSRNGHLKEATTSRPFNSHNLQRSALIEHYLLCLAT
jgi:hypothetical protein